MDTYLAKLEKARKRGITDVLEMATARSSYSCIREKSLKDCVIEELNIRVFKLESIIQVLHGEPNGRVVVIYLW